MATRIWASGKSGAQQTECQRRQNNVSRRAVAAHRKPAEVDGEDIEQQQREHDRKLRAAETLLELKEFSRIDWRGTAAAIQRLEDEKRALEESDDQLRTLREQFAEIEAAREVEGMTWMAVPTEMVPEIQALLARKEHSARVRGDSVSELSCGLTP